MDSIDYRSDNVLELRGPVDTTTGLAVSSATVDALLYDISKDTFTVDLVSRINVDEEAAQTVLSVGNTIGFTNADLVEVDLDDGTVFRGVVSGTPTDTEITLSAGITSAASKGNQIRRYSVSTNTTYISVNDTSHWKIGDVCVISSDVSGTYSTSTVSQVLDKFLVIDSSVDAQTKSGCQVSSRLLASTPISCASYGVHPTTVATTTEGDPAWGYRGDLPDDDFDGYTAGSNIGLRLGHRVRTEFKLTKGGDVLTRNNIATVVNF